MTTTLWNRAADELDATAETNAEDAEKYARNPVRWVEEVLGVTPYLWQGEVLEAYGENLSIRAVIKSRPEVGKTCMASWILLHRLRYYPWCKIPCTAPTDHHLDDLLWPEAAKWIRKAGMDDFYEHRATRIFPKNIPGAQKEWFAFPVVGRRKAGEDTIVGLQGLHGKGLLFILEEAGGLEDPAWSAVDNAFTQAENEDVALFAIGNPTSDLDTRFYKIFDTLRQHYWTFHVSKEYAPTPTDEYRAFIKRLYGEGSAMWDIKVEGEFPKSGSTNALMTRQDVEGCMVNRVIHDEDDEPGLLMLAIDPARYGDDTTGWALAQHEVKCKVLRSWETAKESTMETVGRAVEVAREYYDPKTKKGLAEIRVDVIGIGAGVVDRLIELTHEEECLASTEIIAVNVSETPTRAVYIALGTPALLRDELWLATAQEMKLGHIDLSLIKESDVCQEIRWPTYAVTSKGLIKIESKDQLKKRGKKSPNLADALNMALFPQFSTVGMAV